MLVRAAIAVGLGLMAAACSAAGGEERSSEEGRSIAEGLTISPVGHLPPVDILPTCAEETVGAIVTRDDGVCPNVDVSGGTLVGTEGQSWLAIEGRYSRNAQVQKRYRAILSMNTAISSAMISGAQFFCVYDYVGSSATATAFDFTNELRASGATIAGPECDGSFPAPGEHGCPTCGGSVPLPPF